MLGIIVAASLLLSSHVHGQLLNQEKEPVPPPKNVPVQYPNDQLVAMTLAEIQAEIDQLIPSFRTSLKTMVAAQIHFKHGTSDRAYEFVNDWRDGVGQGQVVFWKIKELVIAKYLKTTEPSLELSKLAGRLAFSAKESGQYGTAHQVLQKLLKQHADLPSLKFEAARLALHTNDIEAAKLISRKKDDLEKLSLIEKALLSRLEQYESEWQAEQEIRQKESVADDLPRVEFTTSKGKFVVELFENEAPGTVGNFISLVESGFYNDRFFHMVFRDFRVQGGLYSRLGKPKADYRIVNESTAENARKVFRGSLSMIPSPYDRASEFAIYTTPSAYGLSSDPNYRETVFGRVTEGMWVVEALKVNTRFKDKSVIPERVNSREGDMPDDYVVAAKVLRKRPRVEYRPKKK